MNNKLTIGKIVSFRGLKGEMIVLTYTKEPGDFLKHESYNVQIAQKDTALDIAKKILYKGKRVIIQLKDVTTLEKAEAYRNKEIYVFRENLPELEENEFYYADLIGFQVYIERKKIGEVISVNNYGSCDVLEVSVTKAEKERCLYFPLVKDFVKKFDKNKKKIVYDEAYNPV